jgi:hypothetical protein
MLYKYFFVDREVVIDSVEVLKDLYQKGLIGKETSIYDEENHTYIKVCEIEEFQSLVNEGKSSSAKFKGKGNIIKYISAGLLFFFVVILMVFAYRSVADYSRKAEAEKLRAAQEKLMSFTEEMSRGSDIEREDISRDKYGYTAGYVEAVQDVILDSSGLKKELINTFTGIDFNNMFSQENLTSKDGVNKTKTLINENLQKTRQYKDKAQNLLGEGLKKLEGANVPKGIKADMLSGLKEEIIISTEGSLHMLEIQEKMFKTVEKMLKYLEDNQEAYKFFDGQLQFYMKKDVDNYNNLVEEFNLQVDGINKAHNIVVKQ